MFSADVLIVFIRISAGYKCYVMMMMIGGLGPLGSSSYATGSHRQWRKLSLHPRLPADPEPTKNVGISGQVYETIHLLVDWQPAGRQCRSNVVLTITHQHLLIGLEVWLPAVTKTKFVAVTASHRPTGMIKPIQVSYNTPRNDQGKPSMEQYHRRY